MAWSTEHLIAVLAQMRARRGDSTTIEVKRAAGGVPNLGPTLCAFANMPGGGTIVLGVDEGDGNFDVVGVEDVAAVEAGVVATARNTVTPSPHVATEALRIGDADVVIVHITPLRIADRPATTQGRAYLRQADGDYVMQEHELRMLDVARLHADERVSYDLQPARGRSRADLVPELVTSYLATTRLRDVRLKERTDDQILQATNVLTSTGEPTLAGLYALADYPQGQFPALTVTAAVRLDGDQDQGRTRDLADFTGPVPVLLDELMVWVRRNVSTIRRYRPDGHMESVPEIPLNAVRELIANALIHRDLGPDTLGAGKSIQVRLTRRNLFIQSPGGLRGVSLEQITSTDHAQAAVNQRLYQIAKKLTLPDGASVIEGEGGGISEVLRATAERGLPTPQLIDTGVQFKALLWRPDGETRPPSADSAPSAAPLSPSLPRSSKPTRHEWDLVRALSATDSLTIHELAASTNLSLSQVRYALRRPTDEGLIIMDGRQGVRSTTYRLADWN